MNSLLYKTLVNLFVAYFTFKCIAADVTQVVKCLNNMRLTFHFYQVQEVTENDYNKIEGAPKEDGSNQSDSVILSLTAQAFAENAIKFLKLESFVSVGTTPLMYQYYKSMVNTLDTQNIIKPFDFCRKENIALYKGNVPYDKKDCIKKLKIFETNPAPTVPSNLLKVYNVPQAKPSGIKGIICGTSSSVTESTDCLPRYIVENALFVYNESDFNPADYDGMYMQHIIKSILPGQTQEPLIWCKTKYLKSPENNTICK